MKLLPILVCALFLVGCGDDPEPLEQRIFEINVFDVGNEGNSSDIRVKFSISQIAEIDELRLIVLPSELSEGFSKKQALQLSSDSYTVVPITTTNPKYSERLSVIFDVQGKPIIDNEEYVIKILMIGDGFNQLASADSNTITLLKTGIYNGLYVGQVCCIRADLPGNTRDEIYEIESQILGLGINFGGEIKVFDFGGSAEFWKSNIKLNIDDNQITNVSFITIDTFFVVGGGVRTLLGEVTNCQDSTAVGIGEVLKDLTFKFSFDVCYDEGAEFVMSRVIPD